MKNICFSIFVFLCLFSSISAQRNFSNVSLVPDGSVAVLRVNWAQIRNNEKLKLIVNADNFVKISEEIGISEAKVGEWIVFSGISPNSSSGTGMIISGDFTSQSVTQFLKSKNWQAKKIGANAVFVNPADNSYLLPIRNGLLAVGTKEGMENLQEVLAKRRGSLIRKLPFNSMWTELSASRQPVSFIVGIPQEYQKVADIAYKVAAKLMGLASFRILGTVLEKIGLVRSLGFNISYSKGVYPTGLLAMFDSETKAWLASGAVNLLKNAPLAIGTRAKNEEEEKMLQSLQSISASYKGAVLSVKFDMPEDVVIR